MLHKWKKTEWISICYDNLLLLPIWCFTMHTDLSINFRITKFYIHTTLLYDLRFMPKFLHRKYLVLSWVRDVYINCIKIPFSLILNQKRFGEKL